jgi:hypothetical protein
MEAKNLNPNLPSQANDLIGLERCQADDFLKMQLLQCINSH